MSTRGEYTLVENEAQQSRWGENATMGKNFDKFRLLMWKNWVLQYRKPVQTAIEIIAPVLFSILLVIIRSLSDPILREQQIYPAFCPFPFNFSTICPMVDDDINKFQNISAMLNTNFPAMLNTDSPTDESLIPMAMIYSPSNKAIEDVMQLFKHIFKEVIGMENANEMENYFITNSSNSTFAGIQFDDSYKTLTNLSDIKDLKVSIRFPGETRYQLDPLGINTWRTNLIYPVFQVAGPRMYDMKTGGSPSYFKEGFLGVQYFLTAALIIARKNITLDGSNIMEIMISLMKNEFPLIYMRRFPYAEWYEDALLTPLKTMIGIIFMLSFVYTCINTVKTITTEKEKQLKEAMKIMGLPSWLHWTAWFVKCFIFLAISAILMVVLLKVKWYQNTDFTVFTKADPILLFIFLIFYTTATITFCFAISVFFSKANTAATIAGLAWFMSYAPYLFMQDKYDSLTLGTKLLASLGSNTAMAFGFQIMLMYEGTGEGIQFNNLFTPNTPDDTLTLGLILVMLLVDSLIYLLIALYVEKVLPGEYGVALPWYFPVTKSFWCGHPQYIGVDNDHFAPPTVTSDGGIFEEEPRNLQAGVRISRLRKEFGNKVAVRDLSLNMFEDQITVLLGHNGAGKTTTMSMLTGMITPSSGTARINGFDIRTNIDGVRNSLGLCPQHNIIFDELTVSEHIYFFSKLKGLSNDQIKAEIDKFLDLLELTDKRNAKSSTLSGGMKRKLCVGMALCGNSKVVMLDEPTAGMDPSARRALWNLLQSQKEGRTMLLSTHFMDEADLLGDRIAIMAGGELQCCGSSFFLKKKFGAGYGLIMDKSKECDAGRVTQLLRQFIPDIEIYSNIGSELTYLLTENQSSKFEPMLQQLEKDSERLGVRSYGISLTSLEEVFMKVGADHGQEEMYNDVPMENGFMNEKYTSGKGLGDGGTMDVSMSPNYTGGMELIANQFFALLLKKTVSTLRSWILLIVQVGMPTLFLIITIVVMRNNNRTGNLPAMPLDLSKFAQPATLVDVNESNDFGNLSDYYDQVIREQGNSVDLIKNITDEMLKLTNDVPNTVRRRYIIGASFEKSQLGLPQVTAWFNNDPYHSPAIALSMALNAVYKKYTECTDCSIRFANDPLPYTTDTQLKQILSGQTMGFQLAFNIGFSMAFVSSFYVLFVVKENISKSKHLQFVSGVKVYLFWLTSLLCDLITYLLTIVVLLITLVCFQEEGYSTPEEIARMFFILLYFGWAFIPMLYLTGYFFDVPSTGYTRMTLLSIVTGNAAFLVVQVLSTPGLDLEHIGKGLHWLFLLFPHYSLATGINEAGKTFMYNKLCTTVFQGCASMNLSIPDCLKTQNAQIRDICSDLDQNYFSWAAPGIGRNILYSALVGLAFLLLLLIIEYEVFASLMYFIEQKLFARGPVDVQEEDSDVAREKEKIRNATETDISRDYTLAVRDLTKYYKKFLAVNGLCLGVKKYECFGLLGVNGAGKTTTFKMMSGDVKISHGDGWVNGDSIKRQLKSVQKVIGYCPQFDALLDDMTAKETIQMFALLRGIRYENTKKVAEYLSKEFDFHRHLNKQVKELSGGNKRKLSTAISLIGDPPVLFLDEPTTGMDPATKRYLWNALCKIRDNGKCIILTSHSMEECEALCTRIAIMVNGNFKCLGSTQHLKNKFAEGYTLTIKIKKLPESAGAMHSETEPIERFISEHFPSAKLRERHQELLNYYIIDKTLSWSRMFGILEKGKRSDLNIEDYSLGQSSLEQVFLTFTKQQN
ncbi:unnamed protein product [Phaedon cochleariae]|uniref:ABC transporter domain-containing protein n=1 Tax=Phaedon cochleariae TaxID=80249 RepID=A0A9N9SDS6_PHACE|nr:unnamed protein product [Phaedon cochleariae]